MISDLSTLLPEGNLPKVIGLVGILAAYNAVQCFIPSMRVTPRIYAKQPAQVTPLMGRMMGTWTMTSAIVRIYTAYNMNNPVVYQICMWTYVIALTSFLSEIFIYRTAPLSSPGVFPALIISSGLLISMLFWQSFYAIGL
ncbi:hypothetical protein BASA50_009463 [Batrachochytrium salamandrivorans]|uniref:Uncharacterized protein n=1 Tax=Batrachochytrium salamandrivorans TaxID=1357716 RepID=A0ABQ8F113_9FUNG|nr:hypothetical protein BASA62_007755 [Batrachochytrium salamandrivorans]KAH6582105.1 hypothetical protein BASA60_002119 [Batrachochytrium salamandrivorans]KAH6590201.1 hypothetical protein BASA50_009463 [Batrachochytrium salamandrivorans]KAH6602538.1 hypothetical protein BASA61_000995 [Batrachochytrium salamandrivorans]KAH9248646.1 hypothetical protein BASA81_013676 [Batrachochytrium salamandrivorans]